MTTSNRSTGKRLPISCQACRTRKIRCSRDGRPCQTCVRRGLGAEDCIYLGQPRLASQQAMTAAPPDQNEMLARINNLEELLHEQVHIQSNDVMSPRTQRSPSGTESGAEYEPAFDVRSRELRSRLPSGAGTLQTFNAGYVRYLPWVNSPPIFRGQSAPNVETEIPDESDDLQLPFAKNHVSRDELLAILPPRRYCDALKEIYLRVFSPVSDCHVSCQPCGSLTRESRSEWNLLTQQPVVSRSSRPHLRNRVPTILPRRQQCDHRMDCTSVCDSLYCCHRTRGR